MQQAVIAALPQLMRSDDPQYSPDWGSAKNGFVPTTMMQILTGKSTDWVASSVTSDGIFCLKLTDFMKFFQGVSFTKK